MRQLRVLGSPSARRTKEPRTGGPPGGRGRVRGPDLFLRKSLRTYLRVLKPGCRPPGPIGNVLAAPGARMACGTCGFLRAAAQCLAAIRYIRTRCACSRFSGCHGPATGLAAGKVGRASAVLLWTTSPQATPSLRSTPARRLHLPPAACLPCGCCHSAIHLTVEQ
jgi:hypothetical protein